MCDISQALMGAHANLAEIAQHKLTTIAQVLHLRRRDPSQTTDNTEGKAENDRPTVLLANTHLFFHPHANHVRVMQARTLTQALQYKQRQMEKEGRPRPVLMLCGDLNRCADVCSLVVQPSSYLHRRGCLIRVVQPFLLSPFS
jgi:mRNA deadenylase 3'-5' endonuclease subunit Ccr4